MKNKTHLLIVFLLIVFSVQSQAQTLLKKQVDSLFVIASSGELKYRDLLEPAMEEIASLGKDVVPILVDKLDTKSARERLTLNNIFKKIGSDAVPYLITSLKNPTGLIVERVCTALGDIKDTSAVEPLISVSRHSRWQVRDQAVGAFGDIGSKKADDAVLYAFTDDIGQVRKAAAVSSGQLKIIEAVPQLIHQLGDDFYGARMSAYEALTKLDTAFVIEKIADSIHSENKFVQSLSCSLLGEYKTDKSIELLYQTYLNSEPALKLSASLGLISADPENLCGFQNVIVNSGFDELSLLKIQSAIKAAQIDNESQR